MDKLLMFTRVLREEEVNELTEQEKQYYFFWLSGYRCAKTDVLTNSQRRGI